VGEEGFIGKQGIRKEGPNLFDVDVGSSGEGRGDRDREEVHIIH